MWATNAVPASENVAPRAVRWNAVCAVKISATVVRGLHANPKTESSGHWGRRRNRASEAKVMKATRKAGTPVTTGNTISAKGASGLWWLAATQ